MNRKINLLEDNKSFYQQKSTCSLTAASKLLIATPLALTLASALGTAFAQSSQATAPAPAESAAQVFDSITVMGEQEAQATPWATQTDRQVLDNQQILNFNELGARAIPGVNFSSVTNSINIRGLDQNRVVTRIDGIRQPYLAGQRGNSPGTGVTGGVNAIDFNSLNSIDIVRGADSSTVGSGAFGGVVDLRTLSPSDLLTDGKSLGFIGKTGYYSVDNSWLVNAAVAGQTDNGFQWLVQAGGQFGHETSNMGTVGGYGITRTEPNPDNYTQQNYMVKLQKTINTNHVVGLSATYFDRKDDITDLMASTSTYTPGQSKVTDQTKRQNIGLNYAWSASDQSSWLDTFAAQVYWQEVDLSTNSSSNRLTTPKGLYVRTDEMKETSYGLNFEAGKKIQGTVSQFWQFGGDYLNTDLTQYAGGQDSCPPKPYSRAFYSCNFLHVNQADVPQTTGNQYSFWLQNTVGFDDGKYALTPGIRYDYYEYKPAQGSGGYDGNPVATSYPSNSASAWSPKLVASWNPIDSVSLYAQYALSFNAPTATQLYSRFGAVGTYLRTGNPNLKPEKGRGWELGAKYDTQTVQGSINYFDNSYDNFINQVTVADASGLYPFGVTSYQNLDDVRIYGIEASGQWNITSNWRTFASLAWTVGKDQTNNQNLNSVAPLQALIGMGYDAQQWGAQIQVAAAEQRSNVSNTKTNFVAPGYGVVDLTGYWNPAAVKGLTVQLGVFNLFDKAYWNALDVPELTSTTQVDRFTQPGRNVSLTLTYQY